MIGSMHIRTIFAVALVVLGAHSPLLAQELQLAPPPAPGWIGSASAGIALTSGNSDTSTVNAAYEIKLDDGSPVRLQERGPARVGQEPG
jgi:hypothetical protein